jgi:predicted transcriptional regulator
MLASVDSATPIEIVGRFLRSAPVDLNGMARALAVPVAYRPLPNDISGKIERAGLGYQITVNSLHSETRQRFTLAHELAHYVLHRDLIGDGIVDDALYRSALRSDLETQANRFAADILMPASLVRQGYRGGMRDLASLTQRFGVSEEAMRIRLNSLGLGA